MNSSRNGGVALLDNLESEKILVFIHVALDTNLVCDVGIHYWDEPGLYSQQKSNRVLEQRQPTGRQKCS